MGELEIFLLKQEVQVEAEEMKENRSFDYAAGFDDA